MRQFNPNIFRAYDIRGKYPKEINGKTVAEIIPAMIRVLKPKTVIVGHDSRLSSPSLYRETIKQLKIQNSHARRRTEKFKIVPAKMITTPLLSFLVNKLNADIGIMITASHNPKGYNGLKIVGKKAIPISGKEIYELIK